MSYLVPSLQDSNFDVDNRSREVRPKTFEDAGFLDEEPWINAKRTDFSLRGYPPNHFQAIASIGNDTKTSNIGSL